MPFLCATLDRRTGGLEMLVRTEQRLTDLDRRTGGLEM